MSDRVGRTLKGIDVKAHPRIFKQSIPVKSGGTPKRKSVSLRAAVPEKSTRPKAPTVAPAERIIHSLKEWEMMQLIGPIFEDEYVEYVSTVEYRKGGG